MVELFVFTGAVYGLAAALAVLKFGRYFFGTARCNKRDDECPDGRHPRCTRKGLGRIPYVGDAFYCPPCLSFWIGMAFSAIVFSPSRPFCEDAARAALADGLYACGASYVLHLLTERLAFGLDL